MTVTLLSLSLISVLFLLVFKHSRKKKLEKVLDQLYQEEEPKNDESKKEDEN